MNTWQVITVYVRLQQKFLRKKLRLDKNTTYFTQTNSILITSVNVFHNGYNVTS